MTPLSRRRFLGIAAGVPMALSQRLMGPGRILSGDPDSDFPCCLLVDAGQRCVLRESLTGFARGLAAAAVPFERVSVQALAGVTHHGLGRAGLQPRRYSDDQTLPVFRSRRSLLTASCAESGTQERQLHEVGGAEAPPFSGLGKKRGLKPGQLLIVPGAVMGSPELAKAIRYLADSGSTVLYESGAAFAHPAAFETEQRLLRDYFGLSLHAPQELWPVKREVGRTPYVRYHWPSQVMVRDFSRVVAVSSEAALSADIAHIGTAAVACYRLLGKGAFIFLGSPIGPHVGFGDTEARRLLSAFALRGACRGVGACSALDTPPKAP